MKTIEEKAKKKQEPMTVLLKRLIRCTARIVRLAKRV